MSIGPTMHIRAVILASALLLAAPGWAREKTDGIVMKNGDHMTGEIKGLATLYVSANKRKFRAGRFRPGEAGRLQ